MLIMGVILLCIEITFFHGGLIFSVFVSSFLIYIGWKRYRRFWAKIFFWIGVITLSITILNMMAVRLILLVVMVLFFVHFFRSKQDPERIAPHFTAGEQEPMMKVTPFFRGQLFGDQKTSETAYSWQDMNIQGGFGNRIIDLSHTVLPDEAIISIRHLVGNIEIYIPYEVEVSILHSSMMGRAHILGHQEVRLFNQSFHFQTENYQKNKPRVKIITSMVSGDIEVKRI